MASIARNWNWMRDFVWVMRWAKIRCNDHSLTNQRAFKTFKALNSYGRKPVQNSQTFLRHFDRVWDRFKRIWLLFSSQKFLKNLAYWKYTTFQGFFYEIYCLVARVTSNEFRKTIGNFGVPCPIFDKAKNEENARRQKSLNPILLHLRFVSDSCGYIQPCWHY